MAQNKKLIILNYNGPIVDSFENTYNLTKFEFPVITQKEVRDFYDQNIFKSLKEYGDIAVTEQELDDYFKNIHHPAQDLLEIIPGMKNFFQNLSTDTDFAINSSGDKEVIDRALKRFGVNQHFLETLGKKNSADKKTKFEYIMSEYKKTSNDVLYVTDKVGDMQEAQDSGLKVVLVTWGYQKKGHLESYQKDVFGLVDTPKELESLVKNWIG